MPTIEIHGLFETFVYEGFEGHRIARARQVESSIHQCLQGADYGHAVNVIDAHDEADIPSLRVYYTRVWDTQRGADFLARLRNVGLRIEVVHLDQSLQARAGTYDRSRA